MEDAVEKADAEHPPKRVKKDRKHWFILEASCPPELEGTNEEDKFYRMTYDLYKSFLPLEGAAVHKDEGHGYYDYRKDKYIVSRNHIDMMGACINPDGRCNCKALIDPEMCRKVNDEMQKMCLREWGISYQTGEGRNGEYKSVEQLKQESQVALETKLAKEGLEVIEQKREELETVNIATNEAKATFESLNAKIDAKKKEFEGLEAAQSRLKASFDEWVDAHNGLQRVLRGMGTLSDINRGKIERRMEKVIQRKERVLSEADDDIESLLKAANELEFGTHKMKVMKKAVKEDLDIDKLLEDDSFER